MKRLTCLRFARGFAPGLVLAWCALLAAQTMAPPKPNSEVKKLDYFAGSWRSEGEIKASPLGPGGRFTGTSHNEWMQGGFFLLSHTDENSPMGKGNSLAIFGYDPTEKAYTYEAYNSAGQVERAKGLLDGDTWTWTNEERMGSQVVRGRYTIKATSPTAYDFKLEMAPQGGDWSPVMEGKATKTAR